MSDAPDPVLRVVPEPADLNNNGHIFGGWVLAMMDRAGGIAASRSCQTRCATVAIDAMEFLAPILIGDIISIYAHVERQGRTSMGIRIDVIAERGRRPHSQEVKVTTGVFTFVALDDDMRPTPIQRATDSA